jgi:hypothetical protein
MSLRSSSSRPFRGTVEIPIDDQGRADVFGMRVIGTMDDTMKKSLQEYLRTLEFSPATRDGVPVVGIFTMKFR